MGVNSLPKTITRQRHDCDLNPDRVYVCVCVCVTYLHSFVPYGTPLPSQRVYRVYLGRGGVGCLVPAAALISLSSRLSSLSPALAAAAGDDSITCVLLV